MPRDKPPPWKAKIEAADPKAVWVRVPAGLGEHVNELHDAAIATGPHSATRRRHRRTEFARFRFLTAEEAALFHARLTGIVEPGEPAVTRHLGKPVLIVAGTAMEAVAHAIKHGLISADWLFVVHPNDLLGKSPETHQLVFVGEWRKRRGVAAIRERARGQGFTVPK